MAQLNSLDDLEHYRAKLSAERKPDTPCISICAGAGCLAYGAAEVIAAFEAEIAKRSLTADVDTKGTGCPGFCERGPVIVISPTFNPPRYTFMRWPVAGTDPMGNRTMT